MSYSTRFDRALALAHDLHRDQIRKGSGVPYVTHLLAVASLVGEAGGCEDEVIAALLHDGPEDQGGEDTLAQIRVEFGERVAEIVAGCSDTFETPKPPWQARKESYINHLKAAPASVHAVSSADKLHNSRSIVADLKIMGDDLWSRFTGGKDGTLWYYRSLLTVYQECALAPARTVSALASAVAEMESLAAT